MRISMSDGGHEPNNHVILLACGTRGAPTPACCGYTRMIKCGHRATRTVCPVMMFAGDVQPLALLAARLHAAQGTLRVDFVTHAAHKARLERKRVSCNISAWSSLHCQSCTVVLSAEALAAPMQEWLPVSNGIQYHWLPQPSARMWANAAAPAERNAGIRAALLECCMTLGQARGWDCRRIILCNLFSLEGERRSPRPFRRFQSMSTALLQYPQHWTAYAQNVLVLDS